MDPAAKGRSNIYMVLLDFADRRGDPHGVYVGMSEYTPAQRFDQHMSGIRAAGSVLKRGIEVLTGPTLHLQRMQPRGHHLDRHSPRNVRSPLFQPRSILRRHDRGVKR